MIIRHDRSDRASLVDAAAWPALTTFFNGYGGGALIAPRWLLTAAHVARQIPPGRLSVELAGRRYRLGRVALHPRYRAAWEAEDEDEEDAAGIVDLAVVEVATPVERVRPLALYEGDDERGRQVTLLGRGESGNGLRGARGCDRHWRRATNQIDAVTDHWLIFAFDAPPAGTELEGVCGRGDSGGPALLEVAGTPLLAGVSSWQRTGGRPLGTYGCVEHYTRVSRFVAWIRATCTP